MQGMGCAECASERRLTQVLLSGDVRSSSAQSGEDGQGFLSDDRRVGASPSTALDSTTQLPRQVDALLSEDEPLIRPNIGRHVLPRMEPDQPSSDAGNVLVPLFQHHPEH